MLLLNLFYCKSEEKDVNLELQKLREESFKRTWGVDKETMMKQNEELWKLYNKPPPDKIPNVNEMDTKKLKEAHGKSWGIYLIITNNIHLGITPELDLNRTNGIEQIKKQGLLQEVEKLEQFMAKGDIRKTLSMMCDYGDKSADGKNILDYKKGYIRAGRKVKDLNKEQFLDIHFKDLTTKNKTYPLPYEFAFDISTFKEIPEEMRNNNIRLDIEPEAYDKNKNVIYRIYIINRRDKKPYPQMYVFQKIEDVYCYNVDYFEP